MDLPPLPSRCLECRWLLAGWLMLAIGPQLHSAEVVVDEGFDGPSTAWSVRGAANVRLLAHTRTQFPDPNQPITVERLVLSCPAGYAAKVEYAVPKLPVIDELAIEVTLKANRPGLQLAAEVVFPRNTDPNTGHPIRTLVYGLRYAAPGSWQSLSLEKVPLLATRQARLMSANPNMQIDDREAYVENVVLVVPGGHGESVVEVDRLTVTGVTSQAIEALSGQAPSVGVDSAEGPLLQAPGLPNPTQQQTFDPVEIRRNGNTLSVEGEPFIPRAIEYRGESFAWLAKLGFNTVYFSHTPTEAQLQAARQSRLWVICPPPDIAVLQRMHVESVWQTVLAWSLGLGASGAELDRVASQTEAIRRADPLRRPLLVGSYERPRRYAQLADVLVKPLPVSLAARNQSLVLQDPLPVLGCSSWVQVSLGWSKAARDQALLLAPNARHLGWHEPWQVRQEVLWAIASGTKGLLIRTPERLGGTSPEARRLVEQLRLLNDELALAEPWLITGKRVGGAETTSSRRKTIVWQLGRSRLVYLPGTPSETSATSRPEMLIMAGIPETAKAHLLSPAGMVPLAGQRVTGGYRLPMTGLEGGNWLVLTDDSRTLAQVQRRIGTNVAIAAQNSRTLAMSELLELETALGGLFDPRAKLSVDRTKTIQGHLEQCDQLLAARLYPQAFTLAGALRDQTAAERERLFDLLSASQGFSSIPTAGELRLLPTHQALEQSLASMSRGDNLLVGGDFEDLASTQLAGWVHASYADSRYETSVEFIRSQPQHGKACLRMVATGKDAAAYETTGNQPSVAWITSPEISLVPGNVVEITGWTRVVTSKNSSARLLIQDTLGGEELALRIPTTTGWQPFRLIRTVDDSATLQLHFAVTGDAVADVDAVMVRQVEVPRRTAARRLPATP